MKKKRSIIVIGIIILIFSSCNSSRNITGNYYCYFCPKGYTTYNIDLFQDGIGYISTTLIRNEAIVDTIQWYHKGNCIHFENVDSILTNESIYTFPSRVLYSNNYILAYQNSSMVLYYKTIEDSLVKSEFYYWKMITSGKQDSIIKANFGDSIQIIQSLSLDSVRCSTAAHK